MTTIYELEKQATPGPLEVSHDVDFWIHLLGPGGKLAATIPDNDSDMQANAAMLKHCRNHFLEALQALNSAHTILESEYPISDDRHPDRWGLTALIQKLETVE